MKKEDTEYKESRMKRKKIERETEKSYHKAKISKTIPTASARVRDVELITSNIVSSLEYISSSKAAISTSLSNMPLSSLVLIV